MLFINNDKCLFVTIIKIIILQRIGVYIMDIRIELNNKRKW